MNIRATIINPRNEEDIFHDISLSDFASSGNIIKITGGNYYVCQSLYHEFESPNTWTPFELIIKDNKSKWDATPSHLLMLGEVMLNEEEYGILIKKVPVLLGDKETDISIIYPYLRIYDCIDIDGIIYRCSDIAVSDSIGLQINTFPHPISKNTFRSDFNQFCKRLD